MDDKKATEGMMFIKPVEGRRLKDPDTCVLVPEAGRYVPKSGYWLRRLEAGDCKKAKAPGSAKGSEEKTETKPAPTATSKNSKKTRTRGGK